MARQIELKELQLEKNGVKEDFKYADYINRILDATPQGGFSLPDVRLSNKIQKQLSDSNGTLVLEEQHWNYLKKKVEAFRWGAPHPIIEQFGDDILNAESVKLEVAKKKKKDE